MLGDGCIIGVNKVSKTRFLPHQSEEGKGKFPFGDLEIFSEVICLVT